MVNPEFLNQLADIMEVTPGTLQDSAKLEDLDGWSSIAMVSLIALADEHYGKSLSPRQFVNCDTVEDLARLVGAA